MNITADRLVRSGEDGFRGRIMDVILTKGYFRAGPWMYYCVTFENGDAGNQGWSYKVRVRLDNLAERPSFRKIRKANAGFKHVIAPMRIGAAEEDLYARYRDSVDFEAAPTIRDALLHGSGDGENTFDTQMVSVYDGSKLIYIGYFDIGQKTMAGTMNIFDPAYRSCSPGKYLMLLKMGHAKSLGMRFFHPGTVHIGDTKMDYKYFPGRNVMDAYLSPLDMWIPADTLDTVALTEMYQAAT
jgi:arginyl-tRNA--protein-N-Asp/Glu arginylyltransferase